MSQVEIEYNPDGDKSFEQNFYRMFLKGILVDTTIVCATHSIKVHKVILAANSRYFDNIIKANYPSEPVIVVKDLDVEIMKALIEFMYLGKTKIIESKLAALKTAANRLEIVAMKTACMKFGNLNNEVDLGEIPVVEGPKDLQAFEVYPEMPLIVDTISHPINGSVNDIISSYMAKNKVHSVVPAYDYFAGSSSLRQQQQQQQPVTDGFLGTMPAAPLERPNLENIASESFIAHGDGYETESCQKIMEELLKDYEPINMD